MPDGVAQAEWTVVPPARGESAERRRIVASKRAPPPLRPGIVDRPGLLENLSSATHAPIVLVSAPAGYGKTTLLALWRAQSERPFAWVSLDAADNDPVVFVGGVLAVVEAALGIDTELSAALAVPDPPLEEIVLPTLVDAWREVGQSFVLVLDDLYLVTDERCHAAVRYLAERLPAGCHLALATRTDPTLPLASLRAHGRLVEVRAAELSLDEREASALLGGAGVCLAEAQLARLVERTEGWPAAMYLAALSLRDRDRPAEFVDRFTGTTRHVADFLTEDVLTRLPESVVAFLLRTSILDEMTASLCDAVTGREDSGAVLQELERTNLFVVPLDEERRAYRYHHLFAEYLRAELALREPGLVPELHRRACHWYRERGVFGTAIVHAHACGDVEEAAELVSRAWFPAHERGELEIVRGWIAGFEEAYIEQHAPLAIAAAWVSTLSGDQARANRLADAARSGSWDRPMPDGTASLESALAILAAAFPVKALSSMREAAHRAVELEPASSPWRPLPLLELGVASVLQGEFAYARRVLEETVRLTGGETAIGAFALSYMARISLREGDDGAAFAHAERAHTIVERLGMRHHMSSIATYAMRAHMSSSRGELDKAATAVERANDLLPRVTKAAWWQMVDARILLAPVLAALGRRDEAATQLAEAAVALAADRDAGMLHKWHDDAVRKLRLAHRLPDGPRLTQAEQRILSLLATELTLRDIGRELYLSTNTVKTHASSIYRKLGVSSRADAVRLGADLRSAAGESFARSTWSN
jgi:LuxR family maltose regulon positive regulatory protein